MTLHRELHFGWILMLLGSGCSSPENANRAVDTQSGLSGNSTEAEASLNQVSSLFARNGAKIPDAVAASLASNPAQFHAADGAIVADATEGARLPSTHVSLPTSADGQFRVTAPESSLWVAARLRNARSVVAQTANGLIVYPHAGPTGETVIHRVSSQGTEDWLALEAPPRDGKFVYEVELSSEVRGLRLVASTLEFLDNEGIPRLRIAPPYLVDANGQEREARLDLEDCAADRNAADPWYRDPTPPGKRKCNIAVSWDPDGLEYPVALDPSWTSTTSMASARSRHTAVVLSSGKVLVAGGSNTSGTAALRTAELYDPTSRTWAATGSMTKARVQHTATLRTSNGTVVVVGGWDQSTVQKSAESYNPTTGTWTSLSAPITARRQHTATLLSNGQILVTGGTSSSGTALATAETLSTANAWSAAGNMLAAQTAHTATLYATDRVLIAGSNAPTSQRYDAATRTFTATAGTATNSRPTSASRRSHTATLLLDGSILLAGGANGVKSAERYDPTSDSWIWVGGLNFDHSEHSAVRLANGRVLVAGGPTSDARGATELFNPTWGTWAPAPLGVRMATPRSAHSAVLVGGKVLVAGGLLSGKTTATATAELYDPTGGDFTVSEYELPRYEDPEVRSGVQIELWASVHRPATLVSGTRYPVLVFEHGAYSTCRNDTNASINNDYANTGACPTGYTRISSHRGYDYIAEELASRGYFVVSINTNLGVNNDATSTPNDPSQLLARGRMILRHLEKLSRWGRGLDAQPSGIDFQNRLDFSQVGLFGHSRGGEAARVAYNEYRAQGSVWPGRIDTPNARLSIRGIFEIGPTDFRTPKLNADGTRWAVLLPGCDGDNGFTGIDPYNRMLGIADPTPELKASFQVYGTNHNNYNTQWWSADPSPAGCVNDTPIYVVSPTGSPRQRQSAVLSVVSFFTANVGATRDTAANRVFDPLYSLALDYRVHRGFQPGGNSSYDLPLDDMRVGQTLNHQTGSGVTLGYSALNETFQRAFLELTTPGTSTFFQSNFSTSGSVNLNAYDNIDFRVDRYSFSTDPLTAGTFSVQLVNADNTLSSAVSSTPYVDFVAPPKLAFVFQTARIPLARFTGANRAQIKGIRFLFADPQVRGISIANIRATRNTTL